MKNLLKSSFRSFFKSKLALALLTIIVFVSASVFTMMHSASKTFNDSYDTIMTEGKAHDFTLDEKYSTTGSFDMDLMPDSSLDRVEVNFSDDFLDIYSKNNHSVSKLDGNGKQITEKVPGANQNLPEQTDYAYFTADEAKDMGISVVSRTEYFIDPAARAKVQGTTSFKSGFLSWFSTPKPSTNTVVGNSEFTPINKSNSINVPVRISLKNLSNAIDWEKFDHTKQFSFKTGSTLSFEPLMEKNAAGNISLETSIKDRNMLKGFSETTSSFHGNLGQGRSPFWDKSHAFTVSSTSVSTFKKLISRAATMDDKLKVSTDPKAQTQELTDGPTKYTHVYTAAYDEQGVVIPNFSSVVNGLYNVFKTNDPVGDLSYYKGFKIHNINDMSGAYSSILREAKDSGQAKMQGDALLTVPSYDKYKGVVYWNNPLPSISAPVTKVDYQKQTVDLLKDKTVLDKIKNSSEYSAEASLIKSAFQEIAFKSKREDLLKGVETDFESERQASPDRSIYSTLSAQDIYSYKDLNSIALSDGDKRYKIVNTLDNDKVDSIYLNEGTLPLKHGDNEKVFKSIISQTVAELTGGTVSLMNPQYDSDTHAFSAYSQPTGYINVWYDGAASVEDLPTGDWKVRLQKQGKTQDILLRNDKKYKITASWTEDVLGNPVPKVVSAVDPSAFQVVVSPSYAFANGLTVMDPDKALADASDSLFSNDPKGYAAANPKSTMLVGSTVYQIVGIGTTPDFMYPIISQEAPVPDTTHEAIIFTRSFAFESFHDAYRSATQENYLAFGFNSKATQADKDLFFNVIKTDANKEMSLSGRDSVIKWDDTSGSLNMSAYRMTPLNTIKKTIDTVAWLFPVFTIIIAAIIVVMIIRTQISGMRKEFGILVANGYSKTQISISMMTIALIVGLTAGLLGYVAGHFLQFAFIHAFNNYWTIPVTGQGFSWISLTIISAWPLFGIALFSFFVTLYEMRASVVTMLSGAKGSSTKWIASVMMRPFRWFGIKTKMTVSIFSNNLMKMTLSMLGFGLAITTVSLSISTMGKFTYAKNKSLENYHYQYKVDLTSPTTEGGTYSIINPQDIYMPTIEDLQGTNSLDTIEKNAKAKNSSGQFFHVPSQQDQDITSLGYLKNRVQIKSLLNAMMGAAGIGTNPWSIASALMPTNQSNEASMRNIKFLEYLIAKNMHKELDVKDVPNHGSLTNGDIEAALNSLESQLLIDKVETGKLQLAGDFTNVVQQKNFDAAEFSSNPIEAAASASGTINKGYYALVSDAFTSLANSLEAMPSNQDYLPMMLSYGNFIGNASVAATKTKVATAGNEHYTHIDASVVLKDRKGVPTGRTYSITGFDRDSKAVTKTNLWDKVNNYVKDNKIDVSDASAPIPVIVNKYFSYKFKKNIGDAFKGKVENHKDRFLKKDQFSEVERTFKIVAIDETYNDAKILTTKDVANDVLGWGNNPNMFNGVFSNDDSPLIVQELNFYSQSSIYPSVDKIIEDDKSFNQYKDTSGNAIPNVYKQIGKPVYAKDVDSSIGKLVDGAAYTSIYGDSPFRFAYENVDWFQISNATFENITMLSSTIIWTIMAIVLFISLLFILMLSAIIIRQARKFIATLKVLGYRTGEIRRIYLSSFIIPSIFALAITIPAANFLSVGMQEVVMRFGNVLVPFSMTGWEIAVAAVIVISLFVLLFVLGVRSLKNTSLTQAFV